MTVLRCRNVSKFFGGLRAVSEVSLDVEQGTLVSLIGPNGAGKTTFFNCLAGLLAPDSGEIEFEGVPVHGKSPDYIARAGMVRTFQNIRMFPGLTVFESFLAAQNAARTSSNTLSLLGIGHYRSEWRSMTAAAADTMNLLGLKGVADSVATDLPLLEQRKVEIGRAALARPKLLLLDEPTAGATIPEAEELKSVMRTLVDRGITILLIEHSMRVVMSVSSVVHVMYFGELITSGSPEVVKNDPRVQEVYLGSRKP